MGDEFFKFLREIQRKERSTSSLSKVGSDFHKRIYKYLDEVRDIAENDPFSNEHDLLKSIQRIATEICEVREHKIADSAVMNIHRSYHLFKGKPKFDLVDTTPLNLTEEEEKLYFSFLDVLKNHRRDISLEKIVSFEYDDENQTQSSDLNDDEVLNRLNKIKESKVLNDEKFENIDKQINNQETQKIQEAEKPKEVKEASKVEKSPNSPKIEISEISEVTKTSEALESSKTEKSLKAPKAQKTSEESKSSESPKTKIPEIPEIAENSKSETKIAKNSQEFTSKSKSDKDDKFDSSAEFVGNEDDQFVNLDEIDIDSNTTKSKSNKIANVMILIFSEINSIMGVDKKIYGPFYPQDIVIMPNINAEILVKSRKGRLVNV